MFQGNWTCSKCGGTITQLPFEPKRTDGLTCRECYVKNQQGDKGVSTSSEGAGVKVNSDRPVFEGNWHCVGCGNSISSLPFQPRSTENLKCIDCFKASR